MPYTSRENFTVRVPRRQSSAPAGVGFVVANRHIVTCAHVVNVALGRGLREQVMPGLDEVIPVEFPILSSPQPVARNCHVIGWKPPALEGVSGGDLAVLRLVDGDLPPGAGAARLMDPGAVRDARVAVFGYPQFPEPRPEGGWAWLRVSGGVGGGLIQLDATSEAAFRAQPGYSGSPVVASDAAGDAVIGVFSAASVDGRDPDSYAIPVSRVVRAWPEAAQIMAEPSREYRVDPYGGDLYIPPFDRRREKLFEQPVVRELPLAPQDFSGRADQIQLLTEWLTAGQSPRMANVYGIPGSGKTALALKVAQEIGADYPDCQLHFDLRASDQSPVSIDTLLGHKLVQLGVQVSEIPTGLEARAEAYRSRIAERRALIVVDNVTSAEQVQLLLPGYSDAAVIVTSWTLVPQLGARALRLQPLTDDEAAAMLGTVSGRVIGEEDRALVLGVARLLGNLPLALRIAGGVMRTQELWTWVKLASRIRSESRNSHARPLVIGSPEVQSSFGLAYAELRLDAARGYRLLGLAPSAAMSRDLAQSLISDDSEEAEDVVDQLVAHQFLQPESDTAFRMHDLLWLRARSLAAEDPDGDLREAAVARLTAWSLSQLRTRYLDRVASSLRNLPPVPGTNGPLSLQGTYVDSRLSGARPGDWSPGDSLVDAFPARRDRVVLMAPGGSGKTTMVSYLCVTAADWYRRNEAKPGSAKWIPLPVLIRDIRPDTGETDVESLIISTLRYRYECELTREALQAALHEGQAFVVADGFDELIDPALRRRVTYAINDFATRYPQVPVLVTTRPFAEVRQEFPDFSVAAIEPWTPETARIYLQKLASAGHRSREISSLLHWLGQQNDIGAIGTPLGLQLLLSAYWYTGDIPNTFTLLVDCLIDLITGSREQVRGLAQVDLSESALRLSAETIAFAMQSNPANRTTISDSGIVQALQAASTALEPRYNDLRRLAARVVSPRAGFMRQVSNTPDGDGLFAFDHAAYREHLAASHVARMDPDGIVSVMQLHLADPAWEAVFTAALELAGVWRSVHFLGQIEHVARRDPRVGQAIRAWKGQAGGPPLQ